MKKVFITIVVMGICIMMAGCGKSAPATTPAASAPATTPASTPTPTPTLMPSPTPAPEPTPTPTPTPASSPTPAPKPTPNPAPTPTPTEPAKGNVYTWEEAINHIGETVTVTGPVVNAVDLLALKAGENFIVGIGKGALVKGAFGFELDVDRDELPADLYVGKTVSVTGKIVRNPLGGASIIVTDLSQISELAPGSASPTPEPVTGGVYTWEEAIDHIGEIAMVTGPIIDSIDARGSDFGDAIDLGMGKRFGEEGYVGIALAVDRAMLPADLYIGKIISVTGNIYITPLGTAGIAVTDLSQISEIGPAPAPPEPVTGGVYTWEEAADHIGEIAAVTGPIIDARDVGGAIPIVLGMGKKWGESGYVGISLKLDRAGLPADLYIGKTISATGYIYKTPIGATVVEIKDLSQIVIK